MIVQQELRRYFSQKNIEVNSSRVTDREFTFTGTFKENPVVIKVGRHPLQDARLRRSALFQQYIGERTLSPIQFPQILLAEEYAQSYIKVETQLEGTPLAIIDGSISMLQKDEDTCRRLFPQIIHGLLWLQNQKLELPPVHATPPKAKDKTYFENQMLLWDGPQIPQFEGLRKIVSRYEATMLPHTCHGDATPINTIITPKSHFALVDTDSVSTTAAPYYDVIEFFNRLWTRTCNPTLALEFFSLLETKLKQEQTNTVEFYKICSVLLAFRAVGNYFEVRNSQNVSEKRNDHLNSFTSYIIDTFSSV